MQAKLSLLVLLAFAGACQARGIGADKAPQTNELLPEGRVIGGNDASDAFAPYQVSIANTINGEHVCGGSIIDNEWVLTAAHCLEWPARYLKVITGTNDWTKPEHEYLVADARVHCQHDKPMYHNDIALLKLATPIVYNARTQPIKLATSNKLRSGDKLTLTGWGSVKTWGRYAQFLQKIDLTYLQHEDCRGKVRNAAWLGDNHICTYTQQGEGTCHGDSGGPLVDEDHALVGIVNWGEPCAVGYPDVFASVAYFTNWIRQAKAGIKTC